MFRKEFQGRNPEDSEELCALTELAEGEKGIVVKALGGYGLVKRLAEMGLTPGTEIKLVKKGSFGGPVEVEVRGVALALGRGVASKVLVRPVNEGSHD
ncbi:MAG: FeoA family protein [Candidatus Bathyarchaeia archaeon]